jgi:hypothetical protein
VSLQAEGVLQSLQIPVTVQGCSSEVGPSHGHAQASEAHVRFLEIVPHVLHAVPEQVDQLVHSFQTPPHGQQLQSIVEGGKVGRGPQTSVPFDKVCGVRPLQQEDGAGVVAGATVVQGAEVGSDVGAGGCGPQMICPLTAIALILLQQESLGYAQGVSIQFWVCVVSPVHAQVDVHVLDLVCTPHEPHVSLQVPQDPQSDHVGQHGAAAGAVHVAGG